MVIEMTRCTPDARATVFEERPRDARAAVNDASSRAASAKADIAPSDIASGVRFSATAERHQRRELRRLTLFDGDALGRRES